MTDELNNEPPRYPGTYPAITAGFEALDQLDPRDQPQPSPGTPDLRIGDPTTPVPMIELRPVDITPIPVVAADRGICDTVLSAIDSTGAFVAPNWMQVGTPPPADRAQRRHVYTLNVYCSVPVLFIPADQSPTFPGVDPSALARAWFLTAGLHQLEGITGGWLQASGAGTIGAALTRTMFTDNP